MITTDLVTIHYWAPKKGIIFLTGVPLPAQVFPFLDHGVQLSFGLLDLADDLAA